MSQIRLEPNQTCSASALGDSAAGETWGNSALGDLATGEISSRARHGAGRGKQVACFKRKKG